MSYLGQDIFIARLNKEFKRRNFPSQFHLDEGGVCNGLSLVYLQYALQGQEKEDEFFKILGLVASGKINLETENGLQEGSILFFASQVLITATPHVYVQSKSQVTGMELLKINEKPLKSSFNFALATSDENWSSIIAELDLQENEALMVQSPSHTIIVRKLNNQYRVYDPNYRVKFKVFANEKDLIKELHNPVFEYKKGNLGLEINLVCHPDTPARITPFPDRKQLYENYLSAANATASNRDKTFDTFTEAAGNLEDSEIIEYLITQCKPGLSQWRDAALRISLNSNDKFLEALLDQVKEHEELRPLILMLIERSVRDGNLKMFHLLETYLPEFYSEKNPDYLIPTAARGGNAEILKSLLDHVPKLQQTIWEKGSKLFNFDRLLAHSMKKAIHQALCKAIIGGNTECMKLLIAELTKYDTPLNEKQRLALFQEAIHHNQLYALLILIKSDPVVSKKIVPYISLSASTVHNTDLGILQELKEQGACFSPQSEELIQAKTQNQYLSLITLLTLVLDRIQIFFGKTAITYNKAALIAMKKNECQELINSLEQNEDPELIQDLKIDLQNAASFKETLKVNAALKEFLTDNPNQSQIELQIINVDPEKEENKKIPFFSTENSSMTLFKERLANPEKIIENLYAENNSL